MNIEHKTDDTILASAMEILADQIATDDGVANAAIYEAAMRIRELSHLSPVMQSAIVFGARYTHNRNTSGAFAMTRALRECWTRLSDRTRSEIIHESHDATYNQSDWDAFRKWAVEQK